MKHLLVTLLALMLYTPLHAQITRNVGVIVMIEDSLTHNYVASSAANSFVQRYAAPADFQAFAIDTALVLLEDNFRKWDFCTMESYHFMEYEKNRLALRAVDFRNYREEWFNTLKEELEVDAILVIRNSTNFTDGIHWSNTELTGYGIYNGSHRTHNNIYIQLEFLFFTSGRPLTHIQGPIYQRERNFPRRDKKDELFEETDLLVTEEPLKQLITSQIEAAIGDANLLRRLR